MAKAKKKLDYWLMPHADGLRVGIKVAWHYYRDEAVAKEAAKTAKHNAVIDAGLGYDFGYQCPGSLRLVKEGEHAGLWEVCAS
jgi:hypothetical protein